MSGGAEQGHGPGGVLGAVVRVATLVILIANLLALGVGVAPNLSTRVVDLGESVWPGYGTELRYDPKAPECDVASLEQRLATCVPTAAPAPGGDPFAPPGTPAPPSDPFAPPAPAAPAPDPFAPPAPAAPAPDPFAPPKPAADPFAPPAPAGGDPFAAPAPGGADPFAPAPAPAVNCDALRNLHDQCAKDHQSYTAITARITDEVRRFRSVELFVSDVARFGYWKHTLVLVVVLAAASATASRMHIAMRSPTSVAEHRLSQGAQLLAHAMWGLSCFMDWRVQLASTAEVEDPALPLLWMGGFATLVAINLHHLVITPPGLESRPPTVGRVLMTLPLFAYLTITSGIWFWLGEGHWSGQAIYLHKFTAYPGIYIGIALYVWAGMLLSETKLAPTSFDVLAPWRLPPQILGWIVAVVSAVPTAYSGASGIFVLSTGKTIFQRLRAAGASPRVALGATAMAGSLGVVLRPCLIVVLISVLNKQVTTDLLFANGFKVFLLTAGMYLAAMALLMERQPGTLDAGAAVRESGQALVRLVPYVAIALGLMAFYAWAFEIHMNEHTAQIVLPVILLTMVVWDRFAEQGVRPTALVAPLARATHETSHHAGALLMVMAGSVGFGGVVERAEVMEYVPKDLGSPALAMAILVVLMILIGMAMDGLGAVILVSVTMAPLAYANGIDPIHFWMMALVAFELGYLHPPVGLNILLARQVVGPDAYVENFPVQGFFRTWEHMIVPGLVMAAALVVVAFVPFLFYGS
jgi:TRAP-type C4-dicarboxylate transport system permease large subunit